MRAMRTINQVRNIHSSFISSKIPSAFTLSSSIHTIHRPVARIHRRSTAAVTTASSEDDSSIYEEEDDFDMQAPPLGLAAVPAPSNITTSLEPTRGPSMSASRTMMQRSTSLATVKIQKRAKLAEKLKAVFEIAEIEEVNAEMPCWLLRSVCTYPLQFAPL